MKSHMIFFFVLKLDTHVSTVDSVTWFKRKRYFDESVCPLCARFISHYIKKKSRMIEQERKRHTVN